MAAQEQQLNDADTPVPSNRWQIVTPSKYINRSPSDNVVLQSQLNDNKQPMISKIFSSLNDFFTKDSRDEELRAKKQEIVNNKLIGSLSNIDSGINKTSAELVLLNSSMNTSLGLQGKTNVLLNKIVDKLDNLKFSNSPGGLDIDIPGGPEKKKGGFWNKAKGRLPALGTLGKVFGIGSVLADIGSSSFDFGSDIGSAYNYVTADKAAREAQERDTKRVFEETKKLGESRDHSFWGEIFGRPKTENSTAKLDSPSIEKLKEAPAPAAKDTIAYTANSITFNTKELKINGIEISAVLSNLANKGLIGTKPQGLTASNNQNGQINQGVVTQSPGVSSSQNISSNPSMIPDNSSQVTEGGSSQGPQNITFGNNGGDQPSGMRVLGNGSAKGGSQTTPKQAAVDYTPSSAHSAIGLNESEYKAMREGIAGIENAKYNQMGGSSNRFAGRYQMGSAEIASAARSLGEQVPSREQFLNDPKMQERYFERYTQNHHEYLMKNSPKYAAMSPRERAQWLGYAHNQGEGGAVKAIEEGKTGADAFGTPGLKYNQSVQRKFNELDKQGNQQDQQNNSSGMVSPVSGTFMSNDSNVYGAKRSNGARAHSGGDWHAENGSPVQAIQDGTVLYRGDNQGYGPNIVVKHDDGSIHRYATHGTLSDIKVGDKVKAGQQLGTIGSGHLHHEVIPSTINGKLNPVYQEMINNPGRFISTSDQRGTIDPEKYFGMKRGTQVSGGELLPGQPSQPQSAKTEEPKKVSETPNRDEKIPVEGPPGAFGWERWSDDSKKTWLKEYKKGSFPQAYDVEDWLKSNKMESYSQSTPKQVEPQSDPVSEEVKKKAIEEQSAKDQPSQEVHIHNNSESQTPTQQPTEERKPAPAAPSRESIKESFEDWT